LSCTILTCLLRPPLIPNADEHSWHWNGFIFMWTVSTWRFSWLSVPKAATQVSHWKGVEPSWTAFYMFSQSPLKTKAC
jgi:hypothetical protein